jgi:hypothetical protein
MIGFELRYVHKKDPEFVEEDPLFQKYTSHTKFVTGFMFTCLKKEEEIDFMNLIQANTHPHLAELLGKSSHVRGEAQLAEFARILLSLKHPKVLPLFVDAYEAILTAFEGITFTDVKSEQKRFTAIDRIT